MQFFRGGDFLSDIFTIFVEIYDNTRKCLSFSLMNLGNSFLVREDEPCRVRTYRRGMHGHWRRLLFFSSYHGFPRTYQRRLSN